MYKKINPQQKLNKMYEFNSFLENWQQPTMYSISLTTAYDQYY
jgi:hypothetical protein